MPSRTPPARPENPPLRTTPKTQSLTDVFKALADETRLRIFRLLTQQELCVCEIEDILDLPQSLVSNHLAVLRRNGLVDRRRDAEDARRVCYRASAAAAADLREGLGAPSGGRGGMPRPGAGRRTHARAGSPGRRARRAAARTDRSRRGAPRGRRRAGLPRVRPRHRLAPALRGLREREHRGRGRRDGHGLSLAGGGGHEGVVRSAMRGDLACPMHRAARIQSAPGRAPHTAWPAACGADSRSDRTGRRPEPRPFLNADPGGRSAAGNPA